VLLATAIYDRTTNVEASERAARGINVHRVLGNERYRGPTGEGFLVSVTDDWIVDEDHEELAGRVVVMHDPSGIDTSEFEPGNFAHATAMAGNIASARRVRPEARGAAPDATVLSMLSSYKPDRETAYAARKLRLRISHNAWGPDYNEKFLPPSEEERRSPTLVRCHSLGGCLSRGTAAPSGRSPRLLGKWTLVARCFGSLELESMTLQPLIRI
jgi:hypothetical protein